MFGNRFRSFLLAAVLLLVPFHASAQILVGRTVDAITRKAVPGVEVALVDTAGTVRRTVISDDAGRFTLVAADTGRYTLRGTRLGYAVAHTTFIEMRRGETLQVELRMGVQPVALEPLKVVAAERSLRQRDLNEYYRRVETNKQKHLGWIYARQDLKYYDSWSFDQLMNRQAPLPFDPHTMHCQPAIYWDGRYMPNDAFDRLLSVSNIEGIEFYPGFGPAEVRFSDPNDCGVILVWSRPLEDNAHAFNLKVLAAGIAGFAVMGWLIKLAGF